jgi:hypothetical protein
LQHEFPTRCAAAGAVCFGVQQIMGEGGVHAMWRWLSVSIGPTPLWAFGFWPASAAGRSANRRTILCYRQCDRRP